MSGTLTLDGPQRRGHLLAQCGAALVTVAGLNLCYLGLRQAVYTTTGWAPFEWQRVLRRIAVGGWLIDSLVFWTIAGVVHARHWRDELERRAGRAAALEARLARTELALLKTPLNPHFLFNTLNTIASLTHRDPVRADRMLNRLGTFLRLSITSGAEEVTLRHEILARFFSDVPADSIIIAFAGELGKRIDHCTVPDTSKGDQQLAVGRRLGVDADVVPGRLDAGGAPHSRSAAAAGGSGPQPGRGDERAPRWGERGRGGLPDRCISNRSSARRSGSRGSRGAEAPRHRLTRWLQLAQATLSSGISSGTQSPVARPLAWTRLRPRDFAS